MKMALVDTNVLFALATPNDANHQRCYEAIRGSQARLLVPVTVLPEVAYLLDSRLGHQTMRAFMRQVYATKWEITQLYDVDIERAVSLLEQYADSRLDFVDATMVAIAERLKIETIFTMDLRHFRLIHPRHVSHFQLFPE